MKLAFRTVARSSYGAVMEKIRPSLGLRRWGLWLAYRARSYGGMYEFFKGVAELSKGRPLDVGNVE